MQVRRVSRGRDWSQHLDRKSRRASKAVYKGQPKQALITLRKNFYWRHFKSPFLSTRQLKLGFERDGAAWETQPWSHSVRLAGIISRHTKLLPGITCIWEVASQKSESYLDVVWCQVLQLDPGFWEDLPLSLAQLIERFEYTESHTST